MALAQQECFQARNNNKRWRWCEEWGKPKIIYHICGGGNLDEGRLNVVGKSKAPFVVTGAWLVEWLVGWLVGWLVVLSSGANISLGHSNGLHSS